MAILTVGLAQVAHVAIFNFSQNPDNYSKGFGNIFTVIGHNLVNLKDYLWLSFTFCIPLLFRWKSFVRYKEWYITLLLFIATVLVYRGARYNIRYFLPVAPLFAWIIYNNLAIVGREIRYVLLFVFAAANLFHTLYYNNVWIKEKVGYFCELENHDNLRLAVEQYNRKKEVDEINKHVTEKRNVLFFARSYYKEGLWYVWERDGLFSKKLKIEYLRKPDWEYISKYGKTHNLGEAMLYTRSEIDNNKRYLGIRVKKIANMTYLLFF
jgi:hypothetical protein